MRSAHFLCPSLLCHSTHGCLGYFSRSGMNVPHSPRCCESGFCARGSYVPLNNCFPFPWLLCLLSARYDEKAAARAERLQRKLLPELDVQPDDELLQCSLRGA